jgi:hypothetical protein
MRKTWTRTYFADWYNANLAPFLNSLSQFDQLRPHGNRLFVVRVLRYEEVGSGIIDDNATVFKNLPPREDHKVFIIGEIKAFSMEGMDWMMFPSTLKALDAGTTCAGSRIYGAIVIPDWKSYCVNFRSYEWIKVRHIRTQWGSFKIIWIKFCTGSVIRNNFHRTNISSDTKSCMSSDNIPNSILNIGEGWCLGIIILALNCDKRIIRVVIESAKLSQLK